MAENGKKSCTRQSRSPRKNAKSSGELLVEPPPHLWENKKKRTIEETKGLKLTTAQISEPKNAMHLKTLECFERIGIG